MSLTQLRETMSNIYNIWGSNFDHRQKRTPKVFKKNDKSSNPQNQYKHYLIGIVYIKNKK